MSGNQSWIESYERATLADSAPGTSSETGGGGKVLLGCCAAFCLPGLGHLIFGRLVTGILATVLTLGSAAGVYALRHAPAHLSTMFTLAALAAGIYVLQVIDAGRGARGRDVPLLSLPPARFIVGLLLAAGGLYWQRTAVVALQEHAYELCYSPTPSMSPAIGVSDYFLHLKNQPVKRWDIAGISMPQTYPFPQPEMIKRVVGLPGETVELTPAGVLINGQVITPPAGVGPYAAVNLRDQPLRQPDPRIAGNGCWGRPIRLGADEYFLLGDNTRTSYDARFWPSIDGRQPGALPASRVNGRVAAVVWPPHRARLFEEESRE